MHQLPASGQSTTVLHDANVDGNAQTINQMTHNPLAVDAAVKNMHLDFLKPHLDADSDNSAESLSKAEQQPEVAFKTDDLRTSQDDKRLTGAYPEGEKQQLPPSRTAAESQRGMALFIYFLGVQS